MDNEAEQKDTDCAQNECAAQQGSGTLSYNSDEYHRLQARCECMRMATGVVSSGNSVTNDAVALAREYYSFVTETVEAK